MPFRDIISASPYRRLQHKDAAVKHIRLDSQPEVVRQFVLGLSIPPDGAVLELSGQAVACVLPPPTATDGSGPKNEQRPPNVGMLQALHEMEEVRKGMNPKKDEKDYLREARSGAMYDLGDDD